MATSRLSELLAGVPDMPDIWGEGALFAFSGLDGATCAASQFAGTLGAQPLEFLFHTPLRRRLRVYMPSPQEWAIVTGDVIAATVPAGDFVVAYSHWHTLVGTLPQGTPLLSTEGEPERSPERRQASVDSGHKDAICLAYGDGRFALAYGSSEDEAWRRVHAGMELDPLAVARQRCMFYQSLPTVAQPSSDRLLKKCASVMKVNTLAAEATVQQIWSTPDRVPHRHMWLWDSVFHSLAMNRLRPDVAWQELKSVLDTQKPDGMIPHQCSVSGQTSAITQPPLLAWGVWANYQAQPDSSRLSYALPRLERYLQWDRSQRDQNHNDLLEWFIEGDVRCRSGESGLDNSPRFDGAIVLDAVDFSTFAALDMGYTARIAAAMGRAERATYWQEQATRTADAVINHLWDEQAGFYCDRTMDGQSTGVLAASGFLPLLLHGLPPHHVDALVQALQDPERFSAAFPVPSVALCHPEWSTDMWRGATWVNLNYLISKGLRQQGRRDVAARLAAQTVACLQKYYEQYGVLFEFFDAKDERPPLACDRKGPRREPYDLRVKMDSIRDYHWTAALVFCLLLDSA